MNQCSQLFTTLPACLAAAVLLTVVPDLDAQVRYRVDRNENFRQEPGPQARLLATVNAGTEVVGGTARDGWVEVTLEGWIWARSVAPDRGRGFDLAVTRTGGENLRAAPNGDIVARLLAGFLLREMERRDGWVRIRRQGWMWGRSLSRLETREPVVEAADAESLPPAGTEPVAPSLDRAVVVPRSAMLRTPGGDTLGRIDGETPARILTRSDEWVRVQVEGWVLESDLRPGTDGVLAGVTAAEVRSRPTEYTGRLLQWSLQFISIQTADELRREIPPGRRYALARGPVPEAGFVYVILSAEQVRVFERLAPLSQVMVIGRLHAAQAQYVGNPVLELVEFEVVRP